MRNLDQDFGWASVVNLKRTKSEPTDADGGGMPEESFVADVLLHVTKATAKSRVASELCAVPPGETGEMVVIPILLPLIQQISTIRLFIPQDLRPLDNRMAVLKAIREALKRFPVTPLLDPVTDMKIGDSEFKAGLRFSFDESLLRRFTGIFVLYSTNLGLQTNLFQRLQNVKEDSYCFFKNPIVERTNHSLH